jgi:hypothetical protein
MDCIPNDTAQYCIENVIYLLIIIIEACAAQMKTSNNFIIMLCIYRSCGNVEFIKQLELILKVIYKPKFEIIICGDFNVHFVGN